MYFEKQSGLTKSKILYPKMLIISRVLGYVPLLIGWGIFLLWTAIFLLSSKSIEALQVAGFFWIVIGFVLAVAGLLLLLIYSIANWGNNNQESLKVLGIILSNIPSVILILYLHSAINTQFH